MTERTFDCILRKDPRSRAYPVRSAMACDAEPQSRLWDCAKNLDQGSEGACVGFGCAHELIAEPVPALSVDNRYARERIYWPAQTIDPWPGGAYEGAESYYEGTSLLAGLRTVRRLGWCSEYRWSFTLDDLILGIANCGPAIVATEWLDDMAHPDGTGMIYATGKLQGHHCYIIRGADMDMGMFRIRNSWGEPWGIHGDAFISFEDFWRLMEHEGEAAFLVGRTMPCESAA